MPYHFSYTEKHVETAQIQTKALTLLDQFVPLYERNLQYDLGSHNLLHTYYNQIPQYSILSLFTHVTSFMSSPLEATSVAINMDTRPVLYKTKK